jgi:CDP-diacylglycerol--glycerol-3-phosphate 3-phosphatidyltransferase
MRNRGDASFADISGAYRVHRKIVEIAHDCLDSLADKLIRAGVRANAVTTASLFLAAVAGVLLSMGRFAPAAVTMSVASLGDALDGRVARRSGTASRGGALLDASADRYGEFFFLAGLAVYLRGSAGALVLTLCALAGSFMVSYGSAKAEGLRVPVPPGPMRRAERAIWLCAGVALAAPFEWLAKGGVVPAWAAHAPVFLALGALAVIGNASAIHRLRRLSRGAGPPPRVARSDRDSKEPGGVPTPHALRVR